MSAGVVATLLQLAHLGSAAAFSTPTSFKFVGDAKSSIRVPAAAGLSLPDFLLSDDSDQTLLGTSDGFWLKDGKWECAQQPVKWFTLEVQPVFVEEIERPRDTSGGRPLRVNVVDAFVRVPTTGESSSGPLREMMSKAQIASCNSLTWSPSAAGGWELNADFSLTLTLKSSGRMKVPRGIFERIGSGIVRSTCKERIEGYLRDVVDGYRDAAADATRAADGG